MNTDYLIRVVRFLKFYADVRFMFVCDTKIIYQEPCAAFEWCLAPKIYFIMNFYFVCTMRVEAFVLI